MTTQSLTIVALKVETASLVAVVDRSSAIIIAVVTQVRQILNNKPSHSTSIFEDNILRPDSQQYQRVRDDLGPGGGGLTVRVEILQGSEGKAVIESVYLITEQDKN